MKSQQVFIVMYNNRYGNGDQKKIEVVLKDEKDFKKWLKNHNYDRDAEPETKEEFDLIPVNLLTFD